jgi:hypothetical protein
MRDWWKGLAVASMFCAVGARAADDVAGNLLLINDNAAWSWYEDERAIVDPITGKVLVGSVGNSAGAGGAARGGKVEVASFGLTDRKVKMATLGTLPGDDHNSPAFLVRPDGKYLALYSGHASDNLTRYRISTSAGDAINWQPEQTFNNGVGTTYSNVFRLANEAKTYNFTRTTGFDPNVLVSTDDGANWSAVGKLLQDPANDDATRPYVKYASDSLGRIHFISTEGHPRDVDNGIYHGYVQGGNVYKSDGTLVGALGSAPSVTNFTAVLPPDSVIGGTTRTNMWTTDLALDSGGNPTAVFTSRVNGDTNDHRLYYARWTGSAWSVNELAKMGAGLYTPENDYTGTASIDPRDPGTVYISTAIDPRNDAALAHHEIFKGTTTNGGTSWAWTAVTSNSTVENLRPIVPDWAGGKALFWMRGTYTSYTNYDMAAVGLLEATGEAVAKFAYTDATTSNTSRADGQAFTPTSGSGGGPSDGNWHQRSGFGNGGSVFTANETGAVENVPVLKTALSVLTPGTYDVYAMFWANPNEDWQILAGLSETEMRVYEKDFSEQVSVDDSTAALVLTGATVNLYKAYLGRVSVGVGENVFVYVDSSTYAAGTGSRTWYDGVGIAPLSVPEPGASAWTVLGVGLFVRQRGRRRKG